MHVALLRGINVGGKHKLPMADLRAIFDAAGCENVHTYIQSGNVIFDASPALARKIPSVVAAAIEQRFGFGAPVVVRSAKELAAVAKNNPFDDTSAVSVLFLADRPSAAALRRLDPDRSPPDTFVARGKEIYLHCPNGVARTKLTNAWFDSTLKTTSTARGWKTLLKLVEMT